MAEASFLFVREGDKWSLANAGHSLLPSWAKRKLSQDERTVLGVVDPFMEAWIRQDYDRLAHAMIAADGHALGAQEAREWANRQRKAPRRVVFVSVPGFRTSDSPDYVATTAPRTSSDQAAVLVWTVARWKKLETVVAGTSILLHLRRSPGGEWKVIAPAQSSPGSASAQSGTAPSPDPPDASIVPGIPR
jgi:hypothetical protein